MIINKETFNKVLTAIRISNMNNAEIAAHFNISVRQVKRIKEAGVWERWPYIVAKTTYGYNTPEYKRYLKRRGLPLVPQVKKVTYITISNDQLDNLKGGSANKITQRRSLLDRILRRK